MRILISNDDGIFAPGLMALVRTFSAAGHTVYVAAPDSQRSAASHSMTLFQPLTARADMASFVDSMAAPLSVINALIVALGLRRKDELSEHFRLMEGIWDEYRVYVGKDRV